MFLMRLKQYKIGITVVKINFVIIKWDKWDYVRLYFYFTKDKCELLTNECIVDGLGASDQWSKRGKVILKRLILFIFRLLWQEEVKEIVPADKDRVLLEN